MCVSNIIACIHYIATFAFATGGAAIITVGILWSKRVSDFEVDSDVLTSSPVFITIAIGSVLILLALLGWWGACANSHCILFTYSTLLTLIFIAQVVLAILIFVFGSNLDGVFHDYLTTELRNCDRTNSAFSLFKTLESELKCCGVDGVADFAQYPKCGELIGYCPASFGSIVSGCSDALSKYVVEYSNIVGGVAIGIAALEVFGAIAGCALASWVRKNI